jgi:hypothetical protein
MIFVKAPISQSATFSLGWKGLQRTNSLAFVKTVKILKCGEYSPRGAMFTKLNNLCNSRIGPISQSVP